MGRIFLGAWALGAGVMLGASLVLAPFVIWRLKLTRTWGVLLTGGYLVYVTSVLF